MIPRSSRLFASSSRTLFARSATASLQHTTSRPLPSLATTSSALVSSRSFASSRRSEKDKPWDNPPSNKEGEEKKVSPDGDVAAAVEGDDGTGKSPKAAIPSAATSESAQSADQSSSSSSSSSSASSSPSTSPSSSADPPSTSSSKRSSKKPNYPSKLSSSKSSASTSPISAALSPSPRTSKATLQDVAEMNYVPVQTLDQLLIIPTNSVVMPHLKRNFNIHDKGVIAAIRDLIKHDKPYVGVFLHQNQGIEDVISSPSEVASTGLVCHIDAFSPKDRDETTWLLVIHPISRVRIDSLHPMITPDEAQKIEDEKVVALAESKTQQEEAEPSSFELKKDGDALPEAEQKGDGEVTSFEKVEEASSVGSGEEEAEPVVEAKPAEEEINMDLSVAEILAHRAVTVADVTHLLTTSPVSSDSAESARIALESTELHKSILMLFSDLVNKAPKILERASSLPEPLRRYYELPMDEFADVVASLTENPTAAERQAVLDAVDMRTRLRAAMACVKKDLDNLEIMMMVKNEMERAIGERNKEHIIGEQMKALKKISGKKDDREVQLEKFRRNLEGSKMPKDVEEVFESEAAKFLQMDGREAEVGVLRNYLDWLSSIPWGRFTVDSFDLASASRILNEDHYGLDDLKKRIEEFIAVGKIKGTIDGKILCLYGPPGVGKTSIAKSIARALDRKFYRLSLGGMRDVAELKGHRRTYVGALPGKAVAALKQAGSSNPVILLDEIDKVSNINAGGQGGGDPSAALLEMLDPEQNSTFTDAYLDVPLDLSKVLFVCTANEISHLSAPLRDRMEMMEVSGYVTEEKMAIARDYLIPQVAKGTGLEKVDVTVEEDALKSMIEDYARETGVRSLKKLLDQVYRKVAAQVVRSSDGIEASSPLSSDTVVELDPSLPTTEAPIQGTVPEPAVSSATPSSSEPSTDSSSPSSVTDSPADSSSSTAPIVAAPGTTTTLHVKPLSIPSSVSIKVTSENLKDYIGQPSFAKDRIYARAPPPGVCNGLGYNGMGGSLLPIEVTLMPGKGRFQATGKLGDVISESVKIAVSYIRVNAFALGITPQDTDILLGESSDKDLHLHMPDGGTGKDGPSAGIAILSAMISTLTRTPISPDLAMTGELSLGGQVLAVGGLKEKILAAHRAKVTKLILPASVRNTVEKDVPPSVKAGIELVYATNAREVLYEVFKDTHLPAQWKGKFPLEEEYFGIGGLKDAGVGVGGGEPAVDVSS